MDTSVRVLVANRPRLMRELVLSTLSEQAGIRVVGEAKNEQDVPSLVAETRPDFLLIALDESQKRPALCDLLLKEFPALRIIAVARRVLQSYERLFAAFGFPVAERVRTASHAAAD